MLSRMTSVSDDYAIILTPRQLVQKLREMLLRSKFSADDAPYAVSEILDAEYDEQMEIHDEASHRDYLWSSSHPAGMAWRILREGQDLYAFSRRINHTKDPMRKQRLEARGRAMVRDLYDRRLAALAALDQYLAEEETSMRADWRHAPEDYICRFCALAAPGFQGGEINHPDDIVLRTDRATAFVSPRWWPNNKGHVLVVPNAHAENIYDLPPEDGHAVFDLVQQIAIAIRATYGCQGVSTRQHNEPAGNQDVWHLHMHVFPRYEGDQLYQSRALPDWASTAERAAYAQRLRDYLTVSRTQAK
jgi:histidine triad (HIT) family protein